ncbi:MAG: glucose 1-dehydrogenase [Caulobacterales bacterium]
MTTTFKPMSMSGRTAFVTGASSGLGRRFALLLAAAGAKVALAARRTDRLEEAVRDVEAAGGQAAAFAMDVTDEASIQAAMDAAAARFGGIDTVIANAGINSEGMALDLEGAEFDRVMAVNVRGAFLTAREGAKRIMAGGAREKEHGRIVMIASVGGLHPLPGLTAYCASKAAVVMMGKTLAREWANRGVNVNVVCPGYIRTEINADWFDTEGGKKQMNGFPRRRLMREDDLDQMVLFLSSDASRAVTGSTFVIDDGQTL